MAGAGFERPPKTTGNTCGSLKSGAQSGALDAPERPSDHGLAVVIERWASLPKTIKTGILALIGTCR